MKFCYSIFEGWFVPCAFQDVHVHCSRFMRGQNYILNTNQMFYFFSFKHLQVHMGQILSQGEKLKVLGMCFVIDALGIIVK